MESDEGLLGGKSLFKSQNDGTNRQNSSSLSYHLNAKHINDLTIYRRGAPLCLKKEIKYNLTTVSKIHAV